MEKTGGEKTGEEKTGEEKTGRPWNTKETQVPFTVSLLQRIPCITEQCCGTYPCFISRNTRTLNAMETVRHSQTMKHKKRSMDMNLNLVASSHNNTGYTNKLTDLSYITLILQAQLISNLFEF